MGCAVQVSLEYHDGAYFLLSTSQNKDPFRIHHFPVKTPTISRAQNSPLRHIICVEKDLETEIPSSILYISEING